MLRSIVVALPEPARLGKDVASAGHGREIPTAAATAAANLQRRKARRRREEGRNAGNGRSETEEGRAIREKS